MKIKGKISVMQAVPVIALIAIMVAGIISFNHLRESIQLVNNLQNDRATMLNGDRDAYQTLIAESSMPDVIDSAILETQIATMYENMDQVRERVSGISGGFSGEMASDLNVFETHYATWRSSADRMVQLARNTVQAHAEIDQLSVSSVASFNLMRDVVDRLGEDIEGILAGSLSAQRRRDVESALSLVLNGDRDAYQAYVAQRLMLEAKSIEDFDTQDASIVENMGQAQERVTRAAQIAGGATAALAAEFAPEFAEWQSDMNRMLQLSRQSIGESVQMQEELATSVAAFDTLRNAIDQLTQIQDVRIENEIAEMNAEIRRTIIIFIIVSLAGFAAAALIGLLMGSQITKPLSKAVSVADRVAIGDLDISIDARGRDEVAQLSLAMKHMVEEIQRKAQVLESMAAGDFTVEVSQASEVDGLGQSLLQMAKSLTSLLLQVSSAADQVAVGSDQVASASQSLSQGATEQASSLEEISSSLTEISGQSKGNVENAKQGNAQMRELLTAFEKVNDSSDEIRKVVKVIDDIAFQINLLALNANVEAARAGKYGKGFAVVAEEVRNLAVRSAAAVKETTAMVDETVRNIEVGFGLAETTAKQLEDMSVASQEQATGVQQIESALGQIDQVTQGNAASAEETASAAEELASQAQELKSILSSFNLASESEPRPVDKDEDTESDLARLVPVGAGARGKRQNGTGRNGNGHAVPTTINLDDKDFGEF